MIVKKRLKSKKIRSEIIKSNWKIKIKFLIVKKRLKSNWKIKKFMKKKIKKD